MTRDGLEAVIWRHAHLLGGTLTEKVHAVDTILAAADAYAATLRETHQVVGAAR